MQLNQHYRVTMLLIAPTCKIGENKLMILIGRGSSLLHRPFLFLVLEKVGDVRITVYGFYKYM